MDKCATDFGEVVWQNGTVWSLGGPMEAALHRYHDHASCAFLDCYDYSLSPWYGRTE